MKRRKGREFAVQFLFQFDFTGKKPDQRDLDDFWADRKENDDLRKFTENIIRGTIDHLTEIDAAIQQAADHWVLQRMAAVDRNILRSAAYELLYCSDIPAVVTINEAIEIAKRYSTIDSASFINGILDRIAKGLTGKKVR